MRSVVYIYTRIYIQKIISTTTISFTNLTNVMHTIESRQFVHANWIHGFDWWVIFIQKKHANSDDEDVAENDAMNLYVVTDSGEFVTNAVKRIPAENHVHKIK
eukprot:786903_1